MDNLCLIDNRKIWIKITDSGRALKHNARKVPEILKSFMKMDLNQYRKYIAVLDELGEILEKTEKEQKENNWKS